MYRFHTLAKPENLVRMRRLLRLVTLGTSLMGLCGGYVLWSTRAGLAATRAEILAIRRQTTDRAATLRQKREQAEAASSLHTSDPAGRGSIELSNEFALLAEQTGTHIGTFRFLQPDSPSATTSTGATQNSTVPGTATPLDGGKSNGAVSTDNHPDGNASTPTSGTPTVASTSGNAHGYWTTGRFEYEFTGSYRALTDLLRKLAHLPRIVEIDSMNLERERLNDQAHSVVVRLHLTGSVYGLPETAH